MRLLRLATFCLGSIATLAAAPAITGVYNAASWLPLGLTNSGVAQGAIFTITGTGLGPPALEQALSYPLQTMLGGTSISVKIGTVTENCIMIYTADTQVAALLPSATPVGTGTLSVSYEGGSSQVAIQVMTSNFGTFTLNEAGSGPAVVTDDFYNPITMVNPAYPGENLVPWGTGLGAVTGDETEPPTSVDLGTGVQVFVGNQPAQVGYGGRSSSPGLDQINFVLPAGVTGCRASVAVLVKGITGNVSSIAVAPAGQATCSDTYGALTSANLQKAIGSGTLNLGTVQLSRIGTGDDELLAGFGSYTLNSLIRSYGGSFGPSIGSCTAYEVSGSTLVLSDPVQPTYLDSGPQLVVTGPAGSRTIAASTTGEYFETLATGTPYFIAPGNYTANNGTGGADVGGFNWSLTLPASVTPTNIPTSVNRAQDLTLTWSGGSAFPVVTIFGINGVALSSTRNSYVEFICNAAGSAGQFTIPSVILNLLPANGNGLPGVPGVDLQIAGVSLASFTVGGSPGVDTGVFSAFLSNGGVATIQ